MILVDVLIELKTNALNRPFTYLYPFQKKINIGVRVIVPFNKTNLIGYVINVKKDQRNKKKYEEESGFILNEIKKVIDETPILNHELFLLAKKISQYYLVPLISVFQTMLPRSLKPCSSSLKAPKINYLKYLKIVNDNIDKNALTTKQLAIFNLIKKNKIIKKNEIKNTSIVKKLMELNYVKEFLIENYRYQVPDFKNTYHHKKLTNDQINAINNILNSNKKVTLLEGITGSGKTEVYLFLSLEIIKKNKTVLILVPEISLTNSIIEQYTRFFQKNKIAVLHSKLTPAEKYDEYRRITKNEIDVVVGTRSAIFAPLKNIGLIILDEEHVETYKQDSVPPYHAREIALIRAKKHNSLVLLGSATPSLETRYKAIKGIYNHVKLTKRINNLSLPKTHIVDMSKSNNLLNKSHMFSNLLYQKIKKCLEKKEQVVLLINRRGFSTSIICRNCENIFKCHNCDIPLVYHKSSNKLMCHHCDHVEKMFEKCPFCNSTLFLKIGFGIEKIEQELKLLFKNAKILRLDTDISKAKKNMFKTIEKFRNNEADILIGTQMIAKGHDFSNVTLVGVVLADIGLLLPSFRNTERVFSLLTQVIGRSGRNQKIGEAIIQTYLPNHYVIKLASKQDYNSFFKTEMCIRKTTQYPPYVHLMLLTIKSKKENFLINVSKQIAIDLISQQNKNIKVIGPSKPYIVYEKKWYSRKILIKYKEKDPKLRKYLKELLKTFANKSKIKIFINVDPFDF